MGKKAITPAMAARIVELRLEKDGWGEQKWSCAAIAAQLGVSESTVWRVDSRRAAYAGKNPVLEAKRAEAQWAALEADAFRAGGQSAPPEEAAVTASLAKLQGMLGGASGKLEVSPEVREKMAELLGTEVR